MKNKACWNLPPESINPLKDIVDTANMFKDMPMTEVSILPACVTAQLEDLQKRWKEGQNK